MFKQKDALSSNKKDSRTWEIKKGDVTLSFALRIDIKQQLKDFRECATEAIKEIDEQLASMK